MSLFHTPVAQDHHAPPEVNLDERVIASRSPRLDDVRLDERRTQSVVELLVQKLEREGVRYVFGVAGGAILPLYEALSASSSITSIFNKHEEGGAYMADGYARVRRGLGVCCATAGPGATSALTGIACARADSAPVLFISAQVSTESFGRNAFQDSTAFGIDLVDVYRPVTKLSVLVNHAASAGRLFDRAIRTALDGRQGPVHLSLPGNVARQTLSVGAPAARRAEERSSIVDVDAVARAARILASARQPVILAGHGAEAAGASDELRRLAERLRIPVATTPKAKGVMPEDHPLSLGVFGTFGGHARARSYLLGDTPDVLLVVGSSLGEMQTYGWDPALVQGKKVIQIDRDGERIGTSYPVDLAVVGDARAALRALDAALAADAVRGIEARPHGLAALRAEIPRHFKAHTMASDAVPIKPQRLIASLSRGLPDDALVFMDNGNVTLWLSHYHEARQPHTFFTNQGLGSVGWALSAAIGGKLAAPDRPAVAVMGDGAFLRNGVEIHTAVHHRIPVVCVVLNNGGFGMIEQGDTLTVGRPVCPSRFRVPADIAAMARSLGAEGVRVESPADFEDALAEALRSERPCVLDVIIDRSEVPAMLRERSKLRCRAFGDD